MRVGVKWKVRGLGYNRGNTSWVTNKVGCTYRKRDPRMPECE